MTKTLTIQKYNHTFTVELTEENWYSTYYGITIFKKVDARVFLNTNTSKVELSKSFDNCKCMEWELSTDYKDKKFAEKILDRVLVHNIRELTLDKKYNYILFYNPRVEQEWNMMVNLYIESL